MLQTVRAEQADAEKARQQNAKAVLKELVFDGDATTVDLKSGFAYIVEAVNGYEAQRETIAELREVLATVLADLASRWEYCSESPDRKTILDAARTALNRATP